jgi:hypothetical protein
MIRMFVLELTYYLTTNIMEQSPWEANICSASYEMAHPQMEPEGYHRVHKSMSLVPIVTRRIQSTSSLSLSLSKMSLNIIYVFPIYAKVYRVASFWFSEQNCIARYANLCAHACLVPPSELQFTPYEPPLFHDCNVAKWLV